MSGRSGYKQLVVATPIVRRGLAARSAVGHLSGGAAPDRARAGTIQEQYERPQRVCVDPGTLVAAGIAAKMRFSSASE
jgi:hypothetical protein